jgi:hypothetical protein
MARVAKMAVMCALGALFAISAPAQDQTTPNPAPTAAPSAASPSSGPPPAPAATSPTDNSGSQNAAPPADSSAPPAAASDDSKSKKNKKDKDDAPVVIASWLRIEVVGGVDKAPVQEASVYVKFTEVHKLGNGKKLEFDLKTNQEGVARAPDIPQGKVLIQIVAPGWESFGQYYDVVQDQQTIHIELSRPPRWY